MKLKNKHLTSIYILLSLLLLIFALALGGCGTDGGEQGGSDIGDGTGDGGEQGGSGVGDGSGIGDGTGDSGEQGGTGSGDSDTGDTGSGNVDNAQKLTVTVNGGTGSGVYPIGDSYTVTAEARDGYLFERWSTGETSPSFTATVSAAGTVEHTAIYSRISNATFEDLDLGTRGTAINESGGVYFSTPSTGTFEIATSPTDPDNRVLHVNKEEPTDTHGYFYIYAPDTRGSKAVWEFSIYIERSNANGILWQWDFGSTYRIQVQKTSTTIYLTDSNKTEGTNDLLVDMKYDTWYDLRFEFYPTEDGRFLFATYIDGVPMAVSDNNYGTVEKCPEYLRIWTMKSSTNEYYLDNVSVTRTDSELLAVPEDAPRYSYPDAKTIWENRSVRIERTYGDAAARAFEGMTERLYTDEIYHWLAGLYDPKTGGFYYSNSARDSFGYLPDVESTGQVSSILSSIGVGTLVSIMSDEQSARVATWVHQLQSGRDGYLYHPQWETDVGDGRSGRDLGKLTSLGTLLGNKILYDHPYARFGDTSPTYRGCAAKLTYSLTTSEAALVSRAVLSSVDESLPAHLRSEEAFREYLDELWGKGNTVNNDNYAYGSTITSQSGQIAAAGLSHVAIEVLNKRQEDVQASLRAQGRAPNGIWQENVDYHGISGLLKISGIYNSLGYEMPYAREALDSAIQMICASAEEYAAAGHSIVSVYNPVSAVRNLLNNVNRYGDSADLEDATDIMQERILEIIATTEAKIALYRKSDGSFSYGIMNSSATSQGEPAAVPGTNEGDVNGTALAIGARTSLMACFDITNVPIMPSYDGAVTYDFGDGRGEVATSHADIFRHLLSQAETVKKGAPTNAGVKGIYTFDDGNTPELFDGETFVKLVTDPYDADNKLLCVRDSKSNAGLYVNFNAGLEPESEYYYYRFATDMRFESGVGTVMQITLGKHFMLQLYIKNKELTFSGRSTSSSVLETYGDAVLDPYSWFNIDVRVYPNGIKYGDTVYYAKLVMEQDGATRVAYFKDFVNSGSIHSGMNITTVYTLKSPTPTYYLDNTVCCQYGTSSDVVGTYDFDRIDTHPSGVSGGTVVVGVDSKLLLSSESADITAAPSYNAKFNFAELQLTFSLGEYSTGESGRFDLLDRNGASILTLGYMVGDSGVTFALLPSGQTLFTVDAIPERDMTLRLEYHYDRISGGSTVPTLYASVRYVSHRDGLYHTSAAQVTGMQTRDADATAADYQSVRVTVDSETVYLNDIFARRATTAGDRNGDDYYLASESGDSNMAEDAVLTAGDYTFDEDDKLPFGMKTNADYSISGGVLNLTPTNYSHMNFEQRDYDAGTTYAAGTKYVFEADFTYLGGKPNTAGSGAAFMGFMNSNVKSSNAVMLYDYLYYSRTLDEDGHASSLNWNGATFLRGVTYRVRFVYFVGEGKMDILLDGETVGSGVALKSADGYDDGSYFGFGLEIRNSTYSGTGLHIVFDNVSVYVE